MNYSAVTGFILSWDLLLNEIRRISGVRAGGVWGRAQSRGAAGAQEPESLRASYSLGRVCLGCARSCKPSVSIGHPHLPHCQIPLYIGGYCQSPPSSLQWAMSDAVPFSQFSLHSSHGTLQPKDIDVNLSSPLISLRTGTPKKLSTLFK